MHADDTLQNLLAAVEDMINEIEAGHKESLARAARTEEHDISISKLQVRLVFFFLSLSHIKAWSRYYT